MAKAVIQANIQTSNGAIYVAPSAAIEIRDAGTGALVQLWEDRDGAIAQINPFNADANGDFKVYATVGRVNIIATYAGNSKTWNDVVLNENNNALIAGSASQTFSVAPATAATHAVPRAQLNDSSGSSEIGFIQTGTGATARTIQGKTRDFISVKDFGAIGNGVTNDGSAINLALATGNDVYFPDGDYLIDSVSLMPVSNQRLFGSGRLLKTLSIPGYTTDFITIDGKSKVDIDGLKFEITPSGTEYGVYIHASSDIKVMNCQFISNVTSVYIAKNSDNITVVDNYMYGGQQGVATGGDKTGNVNGSIYFVKITGNHIEGVRDECIDINWDTHQVIIAGNTCVTTGLSTGTDEVIDIGGGTAPNNCTDIIVTGNTLNSGGLNLGGVLCKLGTTDILISDNIIYNGLLVAGTKTGIRINACSRAVVSDNIVREVYRGLQADTTSSDITFSNNHIRKVAAEGINASVGANTNIKIHNNTVDGVTATGNGITVESTIGVEIVGNTVYNFDSRGIVFASTASNGLVSNNDVYSNDLDGIQSVGTDVTITGNSVHNNGDAGIEFNGDRTLIKGNRIFDNSQVSVSQYGLLQAAGADQCVINDNTVYDTQVTKTQNGYRIIGACDRCVIQGNILYPNKTTNITGEGALTNSVYVATDNILA